MSLLLIKVLVDSMHTCWELRILGYLSDFLIKKKKWLFKGMQRFFPPLASGCIKAPDFNSG